MLIGVGRCTPTLYGYVLHSLLVLLLIGMVSCTALAWYLAQCKHAGTHASKKARMQAMWAR